MFVLGLVVVLLWLGNAPLHPDPGPGSYTAGKGGVTVGGGDNGHEGVISVDDG